MQTSYDLANGECVIVDHVSTEQWEQLYDCGAPRSLDMGPGIGLTLFQIDDGRVIGTDGDAYLVFQSLSEVEKVVEDIGLDSGRPRCVLFRRNPYGDQFPAFTAAIIRELCAELEIPYCVAMEDLPAEVDRKINAQKEVTCARKRLWVGLIALLGEILVQGRFGEWHMVLDRDGETWYPMIMVNGTPFDFIRVLLHDVYESPVGADVEVLQEAIETSKLICRSSNPSGVDGSPSRN